MAALPTAVLGRTGVEVTKLGYGTMELRGSGDGFAGPLVSPGEAERLLNAVLDAGINLIDTSPDYGDAEEHIGRSISDRRGEFFLATKCGCPIGTPPPPRGEPMQHVFTRDNVRAAVEQSLRRMRTDHLDLVQFHGSPSRATLEEEDAVSELETMRSEGLIRFIGMSGVLPNIRDHIDMGVFDAFQIPYSAADREHEQVIVDAAAAGAGTIIRGSVAVGAGERTDLPNAFRAAYRERRERFEQIDLDDLLDGTSKMEFMLRFTISHPSVHTAITGTANPAHLAANVAAVANGPLPDPIYSEARRRFA